MATAARRPPRISTCRRSSEPSISHRRFALSATWPRESTLSEAPPPATRPSTPRPTGSRKTSSGAPGEHRRRSYRRQDVQRARGHTGASLDILLRHRIRHYHINSLEERKWLREAAETGSFRPPKDPINEKRLLESLTQVEVLERFLHRIFPGKFRFSIEASTCSCRC